MTQLHGNDQLEMNGMRGLIDTNILIYLSNGRLELADLSNKYDELVISRITYMEVLGFNFKDKEDEDLVKQLINKFHILEIDS